MVNFYFVVMDVTRDREDPAQMSFQYANENYDMLSFARVIAQRNGSDLSAIRLHMYPTKKDWEQARAAFAKRADWSRA